jgi:hypothetical protein
MLKHRSTVSRRGVLLAAATAVLLAVAPAWAEDFEPIKIKDLIANPQRYWARGFVFKDVLLETSRPERLKLGKVEAFPLKTQQVGDCYVEAAQRGQLDALKTGQEYIFSGTVYQQKARFFGEDRFFVVINGIVTPAAGVSELGRDLEAALAGRATNDPLVVVFQQMEAILARAQESLLAYSKGEEVPMRDLMDPNSPAYEKTLQAMRGALFEKEQETKTPALEYFIQLMAAFLTLREQIPAPAVTPEPAPAPEPAAVTAPEPKPAEPAPPVEEPKKSRAKRSKKPADPKPSEPPTPEAAPVEETVPAESETPQPTLRLTPSSAAEAMPEAEPAEAQEEPAPVIEPSAEPAVESTPAEQPTPAPEAQETAPDAVEASPGQMPESAPAAEEPPPAP